MAGIASLKEIHGVLTRSKGGLDNNKRKRQKEKTRFYSILTAYHSAWYTVGALKSLLNFLIEGDLPGANLCWEWCPAPGTLSYW